MHVYAEAVSVLEKRLQLLLDAHRYALVNDEATRSGRSVASVIREAIDVRFEQAEAQARRSAALQEFLHLVAEHPGPDEDWRTIKARLDEDLESQLDKKVGQPR